MAFSLPVISSGQYSHVILWSNVPTWQNIHKHEIFQRKFCTWLPKRFLIYRLALRVRHAAVFASLWVGQWPAVQCPLSNTSRDERRRRRKRGIEQHTVTGRQQQQHLAWSESDLLGSAAPGSNYRSTACRLSACLCPSHITDLSMYIRVNAYKSTTTTDSVQNKLCARIDTWHNACVCRGLRTSNKLLYKRLMLCLVSNKPSDSHLQPAPNVAIFLHVGVVIIW